MKALTRILVLAISLSLSACALRPTNGTVRLFPTPPLDAIARLSVVAEDGTAGFLCTAWAYQYEAKLVWLTNYHCVSDAQGEPAFRDYRIGGHKAELVSGNGLRDLAMLVGPGAMRTLKLAPVPPMFGTPVMMMGYPQNVLSVVTGVVATPRVTWNDHSEIPFVEYDMAAAGGASGSPVVNGDGLVVGMLSYHLCQFGVYCPRSGGPHLDSIKLFLTGE